MKIETNKQKARIVILVPDKIDFKEKTVTKDKEGPSYLTSGYLSKQTQNTTLKGHVNPYVCCSII